MPSIAVKVGKLKRGLSLRRRRSQKEVVQAGNDPDPCHGDAVRGENNIPHVVVSGMVTLSGDIPQSPPDPEAPGRVDTSDTFLGTPSRAEAVGTNMNEVVAMAPDGPSHKAPDKAVLTGVVSGKSNSCPGDVPSSSIIDTTGGTEPPQGKSGTPMTPVASELTEGTSAHEVREGLPPTASSSPPKADKDMPTPSESAAEVTIGPEVGVVAGEAPGKSSTEAEQPKKGILAEGVLGRPSKIKATNVSTPSVARADVSGSAPIPSGKADTSTSSVGGLRTDLGGGTECPYIVGSKADGVVTDAPDVKAAGATKPKKGMFGGIFGAPTVNIEGSSAGVLPKEPADAARSVTAGGTPVPCVADNSATPDVGGSPRGSAGAPSTPSVDEAKASGSAPTPPGKADTSMSSMGSSRTDLGGGTECLSVIESKADSVTADVPGVPATGKAKPKRGMFGAIFGSSKAKIECQVAGEAPPSSGQREIPLATKKPSFDNVGRSSNLNTKEPIPKGRYVVISGMKSTSDENAAGKISRPTSTEAVENKYTPETSDNSASKAGDPLLGHKEESRAPGVSDSSPTARDDLLVSSGAREKSPVDPSSE